MDPWELQPAKDHGLPPHDRLRSLQRESGLISTGLHATWWGFVRGYLKVWHGLKVVGGEHIPRQPPFVLVANHASHLDALVLASPMRWTVRDHVFPIAAGDVFFETPAVSAFAALCLNALPMWRKKCGRHALQELRTRLVEEPCAYILFPEGTRSRDGSMTSFKTGIGMIVAGTNVPIVPCYLHGCHEAFPPDTKWPRRRPIEVRVAPPLNFADTGNDRAGWEHVATQLESAVRGLIPQ